MALKAKFKSTFSSGQANAFSQQQGLRPMNDVTALWNKRSGENLTRARVQQILKEAEGKLRTELARVAAEMFGGVSR